MPPKMTTLRNEKVGKVTLRLVEVGDAFVGLILAPDGSKKATLEGDDADELWRKLRNEVGKASPAYFGFDQARARFLRYFPEGFESADYGRHERNYKLNAKARLDATAPLDRAIDGPGFGEAVLAVFRATNLLYPVEKTRLQALLRGPNADDFVRAAARFALGEGKPALAAMKRALEPYESAKWIVVTYLPFLWRPEEHMFLKPSVTQDFAERVGHRYARDYAPGLDMAVYESLLDLALTTEVEIADLGPKDRIDVQSFIWVVGAYDGE